ncbi:MAG: sigma-70 family RNA polymerase sigma factor [Fimbriimonadaceae bacterium]|nr:sigma-70 family RNA polymerase sigma factor [Fimbriimonadaceae bacterium]
MTAAAGRPGASESSDQELQRWIELARAGDREAFGQLYERFERAVYRLCEILLDDPDAAADAAQETFLKVWNDLPRLRRVEAFGSWLRGAAVQVCRTARRRRRRLGWFSEQPAELPETADQTASGPDLDEQQLTAEVRRALRQLSPEHREVVVLHYFDELPTAAIAASLGVAQGTVKSRLSRARDHLERLLRPRLEG